MRLSTVVSTLVYLSTVFAQHNTSTSNGCNNGFYPGRDTVIYSTPYNYSQVMSIIGSFKNLTWSGNPDNTVTLNGTDNTVGTSRTYDIVGAHVVETLTVYSKPPNGPYYEVHILAPLTIPAYNLSFYGDYDATTVVSICDGKASTFNFTIDFCATNATLATAVLHQIHLSDATTVGVFLGGMNFTTCAALMGNATATGPASTTSSTPAIFTGDASSLDRLVALVAGLGLVAMAALLWG